jgi:hypothetical protein
MIISLLLLFSGVSFGNTMQNNTHDIAQLELPSLKTSINVWDTTEVVTHTMDDDSSQTEIAIGSDGTVHVVWVDETDYNNAGTDRDIFYSFRTASGVWQPPILVSEGSTDMSYNPCIALDGDNYVFVAWEDWTADFKNSGPDKDIFYRNKRSNGWNDIELVSPSAPLGRNSVTPAIAVCSSDKPHIVWREVSPTYNRVYYSKRIGGAWTQPENVCYITPYHSKQGGTPDIAVKNSAYVHVVWSSCSHLDCDILYRLRLSGSWEDIELVSENSDGWAADTVIALEDRYTPHIAWEDSSLYYDGSSDRDIIYRNKNRNNVWSSEELLTTETGGIAPDIACSGQGQVHVVWRDIKFLNTDDIYYKRYDGFWGDIQVISSDIFGITYGQASVALDSTGEAHFAWRERNHDYHGSGLDDDIYYKRESDLLTYTCDNLDPDPGSDIHMSAYYGPVSTPVQIYAVQSNGLLDPNVPFPIFLGAFGPDSKWIYTYTVPPGLLGDLYLRGFAVGFSGNFVASNTVKITFD